VHPEVVVALDHPQTGSAESREARVSFADFAA
jgi:hypothetical protein